ncbi:hypothetical protein GCM10007276_08560 [Agaricicola taiwanensis]|uniref:Uncharacterized protein n=1 Tax=Agaricicola taiwanensis TaxID=591372 RepID=A0A8J2VJZ6_9RHOB|nr:hypothetical protein [Agaricicola taiwanensis]GGE33559.1 hypothetical protein GCM10007276_08560 [Agaricicola taiwanensis]
MMPDPFQHFIAEGHDRLDLENATSEQTTAAFQEIVNLMAILLSGRHGPDLDDPRYHQQMEDSFFAWGHGRKVTPEAQAIGRAFLTFLKDAVQRPGFELLFEDTRRGDESAAFDPGGGLKDRRHDDDGQI